MAILSAGMFKRQMDKLIEARVFSLETSPIHRGYSDVFYNGQNVVGITPDNSYYNFRIITEIGRVLFADFLQQSGGAINQRWWGQNWSSFDTWQLIDYLYEQKFPPEIQFLNGNIRQTFLNNLEKRLNSSVEQERLSATVKLRLSRLSAVSDKLSARQKDQLRPYVNPETLVIRERINCYVITKTMSSSSTDPRYSVDTGRHFVEDKVNISSDFFTKLFNTGLNIYMSREDYASMVPGVTSIQFRDYSDVLYSFAINSVEKFFLENNARPCVDCGTWSMNLRRNRCSACIDHEIPTELRGYSERATSFFQPAPTKGKFSDRLTGCELEYEIASNTEETLMYLHKHLKSHAIFKRDGSLDHGVEICTRPASVNEHLSQFVNMFNDDECMEQIEVRSTCGMHVHIDKSKLSALTLGKLVEFMQSTHNKDFIKLIAGRESNSYAKTGTGHTVTAIHRGQLSDRYCGVNNNNRATIELRVFRTPEDFSTFERNLEFVDALTTFVSPSNSGVKETTFEHFHKFVAHNGGTYRNLNKFLKGNL